MGMSDPQAVKLSDEALRPMAEALRSLTPKLTAALDQWTGGVGGVLANDATAFDDGRAAEKLTPLACDHVHSLMKLLGNVHAVLNTEEARTLIQRFCVRVMPE